MSKEKVHAVCGSFDSPQIPSKVNLIVFPVFRIRSKIFSSDVAFDVV